jgi:large subunit ribosomal protein L35
VVAHDEAQEVEKNESFYKSPNPEFVTSPKLERRLMRSGVSPIGSRRRRAALRESSGVPFEQLPYQCFQEARKFLIADRKEKLEQIETERSRIAKLRDTDASKVGGELQKQRRLKSMENHLEQLKIHADINDPIVKKKFEDGIGTITPWYILNCSFLMFSPHRRYG